MYLITGVSGVWVLRERRERERVTENACCMFHFATFSPLRISLLLKWMTEWFEACLHSVLPCFHLYETRSQFYKSGIKSPSFVLWNFNHGVRFPPSWNTYIVVAYLLGFKNILLFHIGILQPLRITHLLFRVPRIKPDPVSLLNCCILLSNKLPFYF